MDPGWQPIPLVDDAWFIERVRMQVPLRAVAVRLADGRLAVYSPVKGIGAEAHAALAALGAPGVLVAPNLFHHLGLAVHAAKYPDVSIVASPAAVRRVAGKCGRHVDDDARLRGRLPTRVSVLVPPATRNGELWLSVGGPRGRAWIVGDAFFNIARTPRSPIGLILRMLRILPGLRIGDSFRWLVKDHPAYRRWVIAALRAEKPTVLVPCHGDILVDPALPERLERLVDDRFGRD